VLRLARAGSKIIPGIRGFCEARGEDVWLREGGYLKVSAAASQDAGLGRLLEATRALGVEEMALPLLREEVAARVRSPRFRRGVWLPECATIQPARLARAPGSGRRRGALHERTKVLRLRRRAGALATPAGQSGP
jgi:glycine/D-amino acid oxidase-like deaminating enzyme